MTLQKKFSRFKPKIGSTYYRQTKPRTEQELGRLLETIERLQSKSSFAKYFPYKLSANASPQEVAMASVPAMMHVSQDIHQIEQSHGQQLWRLAGKIVEKLYGENVLEHMPDFEVQPIQPDNEKKTGQKPVQLHGRQLKQAKKNLSTLRLQQLLGEGIAIHTQSRLLQAHAKELQQIDARLPELYAAQDALARLSHFVYLTSPEMTGQKMGGGQVATQTHFARLVAKEDPTKQFILPQSFTVQNIRGISFMVAVHELTQAMALMKSKKTLMLLEGRKVK